jgi:hypothetical protein
MGAAQALDTLWSLEAKGLQTVSTSTHKTAKQLWVLLRIIGSSDMAK